MFFRVLDQTSESSGTEYLYILSDFIGWGYVFAWAVFAYPQLLLNYKLKSVEGFKLDYPFLNLSGFAFYSIACTAGYVLDPLPYGNYGLGTIKIEDLVFTYHGLFVNILFNLQAIFYERGSNKISTFSIVFTVVAWVTCTLVYFTSERWHWFQPDQELNILEALCDFKIMITMTKYAPLVFWNWKRTSTDGLSIIAFMFDLVGGSSSAAQAILDYKIGESPTLNIPKVMLGAVTVFYDLILLYQHFVLYNDVHEKRLDYLLINDTNLAIHSPRASDSFREGSGSFRVGSEYFKGKSGSYRGGSEYFRGRSGSYRGGSGSFNDSNLSLWR